jgi:hypothetical protein
MKWHRNEIFSFSFKKKKHILFYRAKIHTVRHNYLKCIAGDASVVFGQ